MKRYKEQTISQALKALMQTYGLEGKMQEFQITSAWPEVVGSHINKYTSEVFVNKRKLYVRLNSSVVKNELNIIKEGLIKALNEKVGVNVISDIIFI